MTAPAPAVQQALIVLNDLEALVLAFDFDGLLDFGDGADPPDFEITDARGLVQWNMISRSELVGFKKG